MKWGEEGESRYTPPTGTYLGTCSLVAAIMHPMLPIVKPLSQVQTIQMDAGCWMLEAANVPATVVGRRLKGERGRPVAAGSSAVSLLGRDCVTSFPRQRRPNSESEGGLGLVLRWEQN